MGREIQREGRESEMGGGGGEEERRKEGEREG